ncbi:UNVERIFIED_ORG: hypothetical protein J2W85_005894 [Ensifer adhaerens]|nr:hypothetical protein [Ensifer adhaerens]
MWLVGRIDALIGLVESVRSTDLENLRYRPTAHLALWNN